MKKQMETLPSLLKTLFPDTPLSPAQRDGLTQEDELEESEQAIWGCPFLHHSFYGWDWVPEKRNDQAKVMPSVAKLRLDPGLPGPGFPSPDHVYPLRKILPCFVVAVCFLNEVDSILWFLLPLLFQPWAADTKPVNLQIARVLNCCCCCCFNLWHTTEY